MLRSLSVHVQPYSGDSRNVQVYEDVSGKLFWDEQGEKPIQPQELTTWGWQKRSPDSDLEYAQYDYVTGKTLVAG